MRQEHTNRIHVVAAVISNSTGQILIAKRKIDSHLAGYWEFPGGKLAVGESAERGLLRELQEELGIRICDAVPLISVPYDYPKKKIQLDVYTVDSYQGDPVGIEGQDIRWIDRLELFKYKFPPADQPVLKALELPRIYAISPARQLSEDMISSELEKVLKRGVIQVQLRQPRTSWGKLKQLAQIAHTLCKEYGASLLLNSSPARWERELCDGIHLNSAELLKLAKRPLPADVLVGASCHNELELQHACKIGIDFAVLSPINRTQTHPDAVPLGWMEFEYLVKQSTIPVYALGGVSEDDMTHARRCGAQGIAGIRAFWT